MVPIATDDIIYSNATNAGASGSACFLIIFYNTSLMFSVPALVEGD